MWQNFKNKCALLDLIREFQIKDDSTFGHSANDTYFLLNRYWNILHGCPTMTNVRITFNIFECIFETFL